MQVPPVSLEQEYVNNVYDAIAPHFSSTRYKAWPAVDTFLQSQPSYSFGADVGCGNGKYILRAKTLENKPLLIGCDRSKGLVDICVKERGLEVGICDACDLPYRDNVFVSFEIGNA
jgi:ubiquinone/menaquinone biosynthesis C-methylase UbiE